MDKIRNVNIRWWIWRQEEQRHTTEEIQDVVTENTPSVGETRAGRVRWLSQNNMKEMVSLNNRKIKSNTGKYLDTARGEAGVRMLSHSHLL